MADMKKVYDDLIIINLYICNPKNFGSLTRAYFRPALTIADYNSAHSAHLVWWSIIVSTSPITDLFLPVSN